MEKVQNTTQTTKEFNKSYDSMVALGMVTEENRAKTLQSAIKKGLIRVGKGDYTPAQEKVIEAIQNAISEVLDSGSLNGLVGYNEKNKTLSNPLGQEVLFTHICKLVK